MGNLYTSLVTSPVLIHVRETPELLYQCLYCLYCINVMISQLTNNT